MTIYPYKLKRSAAYLALLLAAGLCTQTARAQVNVGEIANSHITSSTKTSAQSESRPILSLSASAYEQVKQDRVIITLSKELRGTDQVKLSHELNKALTVVFDKAKGNKKLEVQSGDYGIWMDHSGAEPKASKNQVTWVARNSVQVLSNDFEEAGKFAQEAVNATGMAISNIAFTLSPEARNDAENQLRAKAIQAFDDKAKAATRQFGFEQYNIVRVSIEDSIQRQAPRPMNSMLMRSYSDESKQVQVPLEGSKELVNVVISGEIALY